MAGIAGMALATSTIVSVKLGQTTDLAGYQWTLTDLTNGDGSNYTSRIATIDVARHGRHVVTLSPSRRSFPVQRTTTTDAAIHTNFIADLYAVLGEERGGQAILRLHFNPLAPWIWLGALVMAFGGALSLVDRRLRVGAPARRGLPAIPA